MNLIHAKKPLQFDNNLNTHILNARLQTNFQKQ